MEATDALPVQQTVVPTVQPSEQAVAEIVSQETGGSQAIASQQTTLESPSSASRFARFSEEQRAAISRGLGLLSASTPVAAPGVLTAQTPDQE